MRIVNNTGLPSALVKAIENRAYDRGRSQYTTTQLSKPSRIVALEAMHDHELEVDCADSIYALLGSLGHAILELSGEAKIIEERYYAEIAGKTLGGQVDVIDEKELTDWKFVSQWVVADGVKLEWVEQASVNTWLCHKNGIHIEKATYVCVLRDWSKVMASKNSAYPKKQVYVFDVPLWSLEETEAWIISRIQSHENALKTLPECTNEEKWQKPAKVAVMVKGQKRAKKLLDTKKWAEEYIAQEGLKNAYLEDRPSEPTRCLHYCPVSKFCSVHQQYMLTQQENNLDSQ